MSRPHPASRFAESLGLAVAGVFKGWAEDDIDVERDRLAVARLPFGEGLSGRSCDDGAGPMGIGASEGDEY